MNIDMMLRKLTPEATISQIISSDQNTEKLLTSIGMKTEQYRDQTLRAACQQLQWNEEELLAWIKKHNNNSECIKNEPEDPDFDDDIIKWSNWLLSSMQPCIRDLYNEIDRDLPRVQLVHGNQYPWLKTFEWHFNTLRELLERYLLLEKETLIPHAKELDHRRESILYGKAKNLKRSLEVLEGDRIKITKELETICDLSDDFRHPEGACSTLRIMIKNMADLNRQITRYFSVEEKKLFPLIKNQLRSA